MACSRDDLVFSILVLLLKLRCIYGVLFLPWFNLFLLLTSDFLPFFLANVGFSKIYLLTSDRSYI